MLGFLVCNVVAGLTVIGVALGLGVPIAARLAPNTTQAIQLGLALLVGTTLIALVVQLAGLIGWLRPAPLLAAMAILAIPLFVGRSRIAGQLRALVTDARSAYVEGTRTDRALLAIALVLTAMSLVIPLLPVTNADALGYSTAIPARFALDGRIQFYPDSFESAMVLAIEMIHTLGYVLGLRPLGVWIEVAAQALLPFVLADAYAIFTGGAQRPPAYLAAVVVMILPLTQMLPFMTKAHLSELLATVVCFTLVLEAPEKGGWLAVGAAFGAALALKFSALVGIVALVAPAILLGIRRAPRSLRWRDVAGAAAIAAALAAPFYLRNIVWTGNPIFPIPLPGFHSSYHLNEHTVWAGSVRTDSGYGQGVSDLVRWWFRSAMLPAHGLAHFIGPFLLVFLPVSLAASPRPRHLLAGWLGFACATIALFMTTGQFERYFLSAILPMALLATVGWQSLRNTHALAYALGVLMVAGIGVGLTLPLKAYGLYAQAPALISRAGEQRVLARSTPFYEDFAHVRQLVPAGDPIVCMVRTCQYLPNYRREDAIVRLAEQDVDTSGIDPRRVWRDLRGQGLRHILLATPETISGDPPRPTTLLGWLARCGGRIVYRNPLARRSVRDPRNTATDDLSLLELGDSLAPDAAGLQGRCARGFMSWPG